MIFGELAKFFGADFTIGQMIFKEALDIDHGKLLTDHPNLASEKMEHLSSNEMVHLALLDKPFPFVGCLSEFSEWHFLDKKSLSAISERLSSSGKSRSGFSEWHLLLDGAESQNSWAI